MSAAGICSEHGSFDKIIVATGILHDENLSPEKSFRHLEKNKLERVFSVNTFGPAMIARYFIPLLPLLFIYIPKFSIKLPKFIKE